MDREYCEHCGEEFNVVSMTHSKEGYLCTKCMNRHYTTCRCGEVVPKQYYYSDTEDCWKCATEERGYNS